MNEPRLYKHLLEYENHNTDISASAVKALKRHLSLNEEMVPLSLFSEVVPAQESKL